MLHDGIQYYMRTFLSNFLVEYNRVRQEFQGGGISVIVFMQYRCEWISQPERILNIIYIFKNSESQKKSPKMKVSHQMKVKMKEK